MIPVVPPSAQGQEVWARMPGRPEDPLGAEGNVELMGFVLSESWVNSQRVWRCRAFESYGVWTSHPDEEVLNIRSIRLPLSDGAQFRHGQQVQVRINVDHWAIGSNTVRKSGTIEAGWCERSPTSAGMRLKYSYWVRCEHPGIPATRKWYQQEDLEFGLAVPLGVPRR